MSKRLGVTRKILDAWEKPGSSGECIGVLTTSYNFDVNHFEENCLRSYLGLDTEIENDGNLFLYELDARLAQISVMAFVDQEFASGRKNLRWGLFPVFVDSGIQHAKVSILIWENHVRIIIGSANITKDGHRINHEIFSVIDYSNETGFELKILSDVCNFFDRLTTEFTKGVTEKIHNNIENLMSQAKRIAKRVSPNTETPDYEIKFLPLFPRGKNLFEQIDDFRGNNKKPELIEVESPFFDQNHKANTPYKEIWNYMKRGDASLIYRLNFELDDKAKKLIIPAPEEVFAAKPKLESANIDLNPLFKDQNFQIRPHHAKSYVYSFDGKYLAVIGSSNFTRKGTGIASKSNIEANIAFLHSNDSAGSYDQLISLFPESDFKLDDYADYEKIYATKIDPADEDEARIQYPAFVKGLYYHLIDGQGYLKLQVEKDFPKFTILDSDGLKLNLISTSPGEFTTILGESLPSSEYKIEWATKHYMLQTYIEEPSTLPQSKDFLNLSIDEVLEVLRSNLPLQKAIIKILRRRGNTGEVEIKSNYNALDEVNSTNFVLQRTRKSIWLICSLKQYIESHCLSLESFKYRIYGPVGLQAVLKLIQGRLPTASEEWSFIFVEAFRELSQIKFGLKTDEDLKKQMSLILASEIASLRKCLLEATPKLHTNFRLYAQKALAVGEE